MNICNLKHLKHFAVCFHHVGNTPCENVSDVWSFGVTMWEVLSFADKPYKGLTKAKVMMVAIIVIMKMVAMGTIMMAEKAVGDSEHI